VPEAGVNALYLGAHGVPVGLVTGDDALRGEVADWLPWAEYVVVKRGIGGHAAESLHPTVACSRIRAAAEGVVRRAGAFQPLVLEAPIEVAIDFHSAIQADWAAMVPGASREGDRGVRFRAADAIEAYRAFVSLMRLGSAIDW
jgi:D-amino peptidase